MVKITELTSGIRSKNADAFVTAFDIFFKDKEAYDKTKKSGVITKNLIARLFNISIQSVLGVFYSEPAMAIKIAIFNPAHMVPGHPRCSDIYMCQQHVPLLSIDIPI